MAGAFAITTTTTSAKLPGNRRGQFQFTVTNVSGRHLTVRGRAVAQSAEQNAWFSIEGQPERSCEANATLDFAVNVAVPHTAPATPITFHLDAIGLDNPDEYSSQGPAIVLEVPPATEKKAFPWWIVAVAAGVVVVLVAGGVIWYLFQPHPVNAWAADGTYTDSVTHDDCVPSGSPNPTFVSGVNNKSGDKALSFAPASFLDCGTAIGNFGTSNFRIKFSIKVAPSDAGITYLMGKRTDCSAAADFWNVTLDSGAKGPQDKIMVELNHGAPNQYVILYGTRSVVDNHWHTVEVVREGNKLSISVDGNPDSSRAGGTAVDLHPNATMYLGEGGPCTSQFNPGAVQLDDISISTP
jgi:Laminin G domain